MSFETFRDLETPVPVFKTYIGNLLYSTPDLADEITSIAPVVLGQIDIQDVISRDFSNLSIGKIQFQEHENLSGRQKCTRISKGLRLNILSPRQKCELGSNPKGLFVDTSGGRKVVTVANYTQRIINDTHTAVIALADQIPLFAGAKRSLKASARSLSWLQDLRKCEDIDWNRTFLFGVTGSFAHNQYSSDPVSSILATDTTIDAHMVANAVELLQQGCNGLVVGGAGMGESLYQLGIALRSVRHAADSAPCSAISNAEITTVESRKVLVMVQEMNTIREILLAAESGIDFIGTNLPEILSSSGLALTWNLNANNRDNVTNSGYTENKVDQNLAAATEGDGKEEVETPSRKRSISNLSSSSLRTGLASTGAGTTTTVVSTVLTAHEVINDLEKNKSNGDLNSDSTVQEIKENNHATPDDYKYALSSGGLINLWDGDSHRKDLRPILDGCPCHACKHHTRAYIHHLLTAKEMLGDILLYCHNQVQILKLFEEIRYVKKEGNKAFSQWSSNISSLMHDN
mmetsp:Transcript_139/g.166  ORF Transcript_139/g.166 Transcript_139/m.166 type:complete len:517 (-) Transcript_139:194-1744(-)|eukprot:CAMPEP_0119048010 /NCGR_PEP_ID=MMETSP1177-20130426/56470_1 /TAXON_ID=2985 /ORGANISM="Ochromonas sp, Strain CCMP1899" /LENGTH=516 /DNA_ID=CAMNT_0007023351 /DNA_START=179 /DNA_END=1729 /DNA_ORIENTATION=-